MSKVNAPHPRIGTCIPIAFVAVASLLGLVGADSDEMTFPNPLFGGTKLSEFFDTCTPRSTHCPLSAPDDFQRLEHVKGRIKEQLRYYVSLPHLIISCAPVAIIVILMVHLAIVRHFDWRALPVVSFYYDIELDQDKTNGTKYNQYMWMTYLVLRGNHAVFRNRDFEKINWYKYYRDVNFDYKNVRLYRFVFLDKKMLTKHWADDLENTGPGETEFTQPISISSFTTASNTVLGS